MEIQALPEESTSASPALSMNSRSCGLSSCIFAAARRQSGSLEVVGSMPSPIIVSVGKSVSSPNMVILPLKAGSNRSLKLVISRLVSLGL
jgi:hypothetical protein